VAAEAHVAAYALRPLGDAEREWAYALHRAALGPYVERTWSWDEALQRRMFADARAPARLAGPGVAGAILADLS
jgi:hypothetical protein